MSQSKASEVEKDQTLSIPEILADFFLRKIDMPSHSDDSDHKFDHKSKRKKSKHKKRKHKKSKHRHRSSSSDTSSKTSELNIKVVDDVSSSEEMGIKRLKKIKSLKLQSANKSVSQSTECVVQNKNEPSNSSTSDNAVFYGPSLELLLSGVESNNTDSKPNDSSNVQNSEENNVDSRSDFNLINNSTKNSESEHLTKKPENQTLLESSACSAVDSNIEKNNSLDKVNSDKPCSDVNNASENETKTVASSEIKQSDVQKEPTSEKNSSYVNSSNYTENKSEKSNKNDCGVKNRGKYEKKKKHSKSHSRSRSRSKTSPSKSKHKRRTSRSSSRDSHYSSRKKKRYSRSRSRSRGKVYERKRRSYSRSHSRSRYQRHRRPAHSRSPHDRYSHRRARSRSRSYTRHRRRSESKTRRRSRQRDRSLSKSRYRNKSRRSISRSRSKSKSRSRHASPSKEKSRSRSKEKKSSQSSTKIDQAKVLETARKNVLKMMKNGTLPEGLPVENLKKEQLISIQAGGKSVQELTDFCQRLSQKENEPDGSENEDNEDKPDDETGFIHHPFKVKEPAMIKLNIKNAVQLPIKTHAQKVAETARLSSQFPVSSGNQHKQKELEWVPVVPETKTETKPSEVVVSSTVDVSKIAVPPDIPVPSIPPPPPVPVSYPCPPSLEVPQVEVTTPVSVPVLMPPPMPTFSIPPPIQPPEQSSMFYHMPPQPVMETFVTPNQPLMMPFATEVIPTTTTSSSSVFKPPKKLDIPSIVTKRFQALTKLQENPNDPEALQTLQEAQESIQEWVQSQQVPGLFTGSTDAKVLSVAELCGPFKYHKFRKDMLSQAPPVTEGKGMSLLKKMGWNPGEGLGKNKEGSLEPLVLDIKTDKKGLVSEGENSKKGISSFTKELQGKHPVSALMELCSKRRWKPPLYTCVLDHGPPHKKVFCFKVEVNGVEYQPVNPCPNKKIAKADAAVLCLQSLNVLPKTT